MVVRRKVQCEYCKKIISCMGDSDTVRIYLNKKMEHHHNNECKILIREERLDKLLENVTSNWNKM